MLPNLQPIQLGSQSPSRIKSTACRVTWRLPILITPILLPVLVRAGVPPVPIISSVDVTKQTIELQSPQEKLPIAYSISSETTVEVHGKSGSIIEWRAGMKVRSIHVGSGTESPQVLEDIDIP